MKESLLSQMPLHLLALVLSQLEDMHTLGAVILSNSTLYNAYKDRTHFIICCILRQQIPANVLQYARNAHKARQVDRQDRSAVIYMNGYSKDHHNFQEWFFKWRLERTDNPPALAAALSRTHTVVQYFCNRFLSETAPLASEVYGVNSSSLKARSEDEVFRTYRALYRFQTYCNVGFRVEDDLNPPAEWAKTFQDARNFSHFRNFSPWVNEQLACMHDYLERVLSRAFDEVAAHDVEWGAQSVDWLSRGENNRHKQAYLTYGLEFLYQLDRSSSYEQRLRLLKSKGLPSTSCALASHLKTASPLDVCTCCPPGMYALGDDLRWTQDEVEFNLEAKDTDGPDDLDSSPFQIWRHVHKKRLVDEFVYQGENARLRQYGYVMWDTPEDAEPKEARRRVREARRKAMKDEKDMRKDMVRMEASWEERKSIYAKGGRGYWSEGDLSQIIWGQG